MSDPVFLPEPDLTNEPTDEEAPEPIAAQPADPARLTRKLKLLELITKKLENTKSARAKKPTPKTRAESNRANAQHSTGPRSDSGKARASANSLKHGFFANAATLHPQDNLAFEDNLHDLRYGLHPDGPVEEMLVRELAMFKTRLTRLEAAEYALICAEIETNPNDAREVAAAYLNNAAALEHLQKAEVHLRRAYNRTWDRLERMQRERHKLPLDQALKRSERWLTAEEQRNNPAAPDSNAGPEASPPSHPPSSPESPTPAQDAEKSGPTHPADPHSLSNAPLTPDPGTPRD